MKVPPVSNVIKMGDRPRKRKTKDDFKSYTKPPNDSA